MAREVKTPHPRPSIIYFSLCQRHGEETLYGTTARSQALADPADQPFWTGRRTLAASFGSRRTHGALAGPLHVAGVRLSPNAVVPAGVHDSKLLRPHERAFLYDKLLELAAAGELVYQHAAFAVEVHYEFPGVGADLLLLLKKPEDLLDPAFPRRTNTAARVDFGSWEGRYVVRRYETLVKHKLALTDILLHLF